MFLACVNRLFFFLGDWRLFIVAYILQWNENKCCNIDENFWRSICMDKKISAEENRNSGMSMTRTDRKRHRNVEEEASEFMPLSKRINNLHINGLSYGLRENMVENPMESMETDWESGHFISSPNSSDVSHNSSPRNNCGSNNSNFTTDYRPDLNATENPFYYESNKLLFSLYMERMQRSQMDKCTHYTFCSTYKVPS